MVSDILTTKVRVPSPARRWVQRARLLDVLERGVPDRMLTLVAAPAGYGKTTLLAQWAHNTTCRVVWVSLGREDNDLERFLRYLVAAWQEVDPAIESSPLDLLVGSMSPDWNAALSAFIKQADEGAEQTAFILDDYHLIEEAGIHESLTFLLDYLPPTAHVIVAGREEPPLPVARYRARNQLLEIRASDLQFTVDETADFLGTVAGFEITGDATASLQEQTEGWVAGLQLAGLTLRARQPLGDDLAISGRQRFIADYLNQDVLDHQPEEIQQFLLQTGILDYLSGPLCDAVTQRTDSQRILESLEQENLFLVPLDDNREWFRYHHLFADFLRAELARRDGVEAADLHRRAGEWYLAQEVPGEAIGYAVASESPDLVIRIFERYMNIKLNGGEVNEVSRWLDLIPPAWYTEHPVLNLFRGGTMAIMGDFAGCMNCIESAERGLTEQGTADSTWQLAMVTAVRCYIACIQNDVPAAETFARRALNDLREESRPFRANIFHALGDTYRRNGRWEEAQECYLKVPGFTAGVPGFRVQSAVQSAHVFGALADLDLRQGRLRSAAGYWRRALDAMRKPESWGRLELPVSGWVYIRLSEVLYEWNELSEAWEYLSQGLQRVELSGDVRSLIVGHSLASRLHLAQGEIDLAREEIEFAQPLVEQSTFPELTSLFERAQLELWLAQDRLRAVVHWADEILQDEGRADRLENEMAHLTLARVHIVRGDGTSVQQALDILRHVVRAAEDEGRRGIQIEGLALQALAQWKQGIEVEAMASLEQALLLAEPDGYTRLFVDLGPAMGAVLSEAKSRNVLREYTGQLLDAFDTDQIPWTNRDALLDPLTSRELEILAMIATGLTNPEIAEELFISAETVKKHAGNIYAKLGVHSRTEAAGKARELALLE